MPYLVQMLLPTKDNQGLLFGQDVFHRVRRELTDRFGGATAYSRAPAEGLWDSGQCVRRDDIVVIEVVVEQLDVKWWTVYRQKLEERFHQDQILMRALECRIL
jgi:hypothetical protein